MPQKESVQDVPQRGKIKKFKTNHFVAAWNCQLQRKRAEDKETIRRQE